MFACKQCQQPRETLRGLCRECAPEMWAAREAITQRIMAAETAFGKPSLEHWYEFERYYESTDHWYEIATAIECYERIKEGNYAI